MAIDPRMLFMMAQGIGRANPQYSPHPTSALGSLANIATGASRGYMRHGALVSAEEAAKAKRDFEREKFGALQDYRAAGLEDTDLSREQAARLAEMREQGTDRRFDVGQAGLNRRFDIGQAGLDRRFDVGQANTTARHMATVGGANARHGETMAYRRAVQEQAAKDQQAAIDRQAQVNAAIYASLPPEQQASPAGQALLAGGKVGDAGVLQPKPPPPVAPTETEKLIALEKRYREAGDIASADKVGRLLTKKGTITGRTETDATAEQKARDKARGRVEGNEDAKREELNRKQADVIADASANLRQLEVAGGATGFLGNVSEPLAGYVGQLNEGAGEGVSNALTGVGVAEAMDVRTNLRRNIAGNVQAIINEGGKITDSERAIAAEIQGQLKSATSASQLRAAQVNAITLGLSKRARIARLKGDPPQFDVLDDAGAFGQYHQLRELGLNGSEAKRTLNQLKDRAGAYRSIERQ